MPAPVSGTDNVQLAPWLHTASVGELLPLVSRTLGNLRSSKNYPAPLGIFAADEVSNRWGPFLISRTEGTEDATIRSCIHSRRGT